MKVLKARLYDMKMKEQQAKLDQIGGAKKDIAFGSQIRSYVLQPYQMIKDHRTKFEVGDPTSVLDGDLDPFIKTYLMQKASGTLGSHTQRMTRIVAERRPALRKRVLFFETVSPATNGSWLRARDERFVDRGVSFAGGFAGWRRSTGMKTMLPGASKRGGWFSAVARGSM